MHPILCLPGPSETINSEAKRNEVIVLSAKWECREIPTVKTDWADKETGAEDTTPKTLDMSLSWEPWTCSRHHTVKQN